MMKLNVILITTLTFVTASAAFAIKDNTPETSETMLTKWFYLRYSHGLSIYMTDVKNGYRGLTDEEIRAGMTFEPEIGVYIKNRLQLGISYLYMDGIAQIDGGSIGLIYDDVFFSGASFKARYLLVNRNKIRVPIGIEADIGECSIYSGVTDNRTQIRGMGQSVTAWLGSNSYAYGNRYGGGVSGAFVYQPFKWMSFGLDAVIRVIVSEIMEESQGLTWSLTELLIQSFFKDFSFEENNTIKLNFSSINLSAHVSFHF